MRYLIKISITLSILLCSIRTKLASAADQAFDNAADPAYSSTWIAGTNGGEGYLPWFFTADFTGPFVPPDFHIGSSGTSIDTNGRSWYIAAPSGANYYGAADLAIRPIQYGTDLSIGQTLSLDITFGNISSSPLNPPISNRYSSQTWAFDAAIVEADPRYANYRVNGFDSGISRTNASLHISYSLQPNDQYTLRITPISSSAVTRTITGSATDTQALNTGTLFFRNDGGGTGPSQALYFNNLAIGTPDVIAFYDEPPSNALEPGHAFLQMIPRNNSQVGTYYRGFYPNFTFPFAPGHLQDDSNAAWQFRVSYNVTDAEYNSAEAVINHDNLAPPFYNLVSFNCANWIGKVANAAGIQLPSTLDRANIADPLAFGQTLQAIGIGNSFESGTVERNVNQLMQILSHRTDLSPHIGKTAQDYSYVGIEAAGHTDPAGIAASLNLALDKVDIGSINANQSSGFSISVLNEDPNASIISINWGDGSPFEEQSLNMSHTYAVGTYVSDLLIIDAGAVHSYDMTIDVSSGASALITINPTPFAPIETPNGDLTILGAIPPVPEPSMISLLILCSGLCLVRRSSRYANITR